MKKSDLLKALNFVKPATKGKSISEDNSYFFLNNNKVIAYNDQICVQYPFEFGFKALVKASDLYKLVTKLKTNEISLVLKDTKVNIRSGRSNIHLNTISDSEITSRIKKVNKSLKKSKWEKLPNNFLESINICAFSASKNEAQGTLTYINIDGTEVRATNNTQLAIATLNSKVEKMFIKGIAVKDIVSLNPSTYSISKAWIHFKNENNCIFSIRTIEGEFPDTSKIFDSVKSKAVVMPEDILDGINIASIFTDNDNPAIEVHLEKGKCIILIESENGNYVFESEMKYKGESVRFFIDPEFLLKMLSHSSSIKIDYPVAMIECEGFKIATALMG